ncbi:MAG: hypothetical protein ACHQJ6_08690, partial [Candidatus Berkiellales bacterium]
EIAHTPVSSTLILLNDTFSKYRPCSFKCGWENKLELSIIKQIIRFKRVNIYIDNLAVQFKNYIFILYFLHPVYKATLTLVNLLIIAKLVPHLMRDSGGDRLSR